MSLELQPNIQGFDVATLRDLINKVNSIEEVRGKMKGQEDAQKGVLGKDLLLSLKEGSLMLNQAQGRVRG